MAHINWWNTMDINGRSISVKEWKQLNQWSDFVRQKLKIRSIRFIGNHIPLVVSYSFMKWKSSILVYIFSLNDRFQVKLIRLNKYLYSYFYIDNQRARQCCSDTSKRTEFGRWRLFLPVLTGCHSYRAKKTANFHYD